MKKIIFIITTLLLVLNSCHKESLFIEPIENSVAQSLKWRDAQTGIWKKTGWWNSANILTGLVRYAEITKDPEIEKTVNDLYEKAKVYTIETKEGQKLSFSNFINDYYDDEGWWALAWIDAYKLYGDSKYLDMAEIIFKDMTSGWSDDFNGGTYWKKNPLQYKNAIANGLFGLTAIRLYHQTQKEDYKNWFLKEVQWYMQSGLINTNNYMIEDGIQNDGTPNHGNYYTYNQGVAIALFTEMYLLTKEQSYLDLSDKIAKATIEKELITPEGILKERNKEIAAGNDGVQFKGIFIRHLSFLYKVTQNPIYKEFILKNATSIINNNYDKETKSFGCYWSGPITNIGAAANSSALECVLEAHNYH